MVRKLAIEKPKTPGIPDLVRRLSVLKTTIYRLLQTEKDVRSLEKAFHEFENDLSAIDQRVATLESFLNTAPRITQK